MAALCALACTAAGHAGRCIDWLQGLTHAAVASFLPAPRALRGGAPAGRGCGVAGRGLDAAPGPRAWQQRGAVDQRRRRRDGVRPRADAADALARGNALPAPGPRGLWGGVEPLAADAPRAGRGRARACRYQLPLAYAGAAAHPDLHLARGALPLRRAIRAHGRGRSLDLRQLAPAPCGEQGQRGAHPSRGGHHRHGGVLAVRLREGAAARAMADGSLEPRDRSATAHRGRPALAGDACCRSAAADRRPARGTGGP